MMAPAAAVVMPVTAEDEPSCGFVRRDQELGALLACLTHAAQRRRRG